MYQYEGKLGVICPRPWPQNPVLNGPLCHLFNIHMYMEGYSFVLYVSNNYLYCCFSRF